jgi:hypothetical protein
MKDIRKSLLATALAATGLAMAAPASAGLLQIWVTDPTTSTSFLCVDNDACDASTTIDNEIVLDTLLANGSLGLSSAFNIASLSAQSNFAGGDPLVSNITGSGSIEADATLAAPRPLIIEFSQTDWFKPEGNPRTLSIGPTVTFTNSGQGDFLAAEGYNDPFNLVWSGNNPFDGTVFVDVPAGAADDFVTSQVMLSAGGGAPEWRSRGRRHSDLPGPGATR